MATAKYKNHNLLYAHTVGCKICPVLTRKATATDGLVNKTNKPKSSTNKKETENKLLMLANKARHSSTQQYLINHK